eukprot:Hpha_TRINITY_DN9245_c0_g1::TRINITY_DN9245_c0_g1_i1::g.28500::m.28500
MALASTSGSLSRTKAERLRLKAERLYEERFHSRWFRDPSARATRNQYRQLLSDLPGPDTRREEPYMNTLIRGDYYGRDGDPYSRRRSRRPGVVEKNRILQGQPRLTAAQRRSLYRSMDAATAAGARPGRLGASVMLRKTAPPVAEAPLVSREQEYWDQLHHLNRRRRVDFHGAHKFGSDQHMAMALALTDARLDKFQDLDAQVHAERHLPAAGARRRKNPMISEELDTSEVNMDDVGIGIGGESYDDPPQPPPP